MIRYTGWARTLLASAAIAAACALAGCQTDGVDISPAVAAKAMAPLSGDMITLLEQKGMPKESPMLIRIFKEEAELEVWKQDGSGQYALLKTYPICRWSGELGPKIKQGDRQAPEGFYSIAPGQMNPNSAWYLSFNLGFPNAYDRANDRTGAFLMVHGDCSSAGCYAMTDEQMGEIYALGREAFLGGQKAFQVQAYPFRMTARNMARHRNNPAMPFWRMLKEGNDHFETTRQEPKVSVCEKRYVFDAETSGRFDPRAKCPAFQVPNEIATPVAAKQQRDEQEFASLVARNIATAPVKTGADGGMNELFLAKLRSKDKFDENGRIFSLASTQRVPAMGNNVNPPKNANLGDQETTTASVPAPTPPPTRVASADPNASGSMFGSLFSSGSKWFGGGDKEQPPAQPTTAAAPKARTPATASQPKTLTARAPAGAIRPAQPRTQVAEEHKPAPQQPAPVATASAAPTPAPAQSQSATAAPAWIGGTAPVSGNSFDSRWGGMR